MSDVVDFYQGRMNMKLRHSPQFTPKQKQAIRLSAIVLERLRSDGAFARNGNFLCLRWNANEFSAALRTPFQKLPPVTQHMRYMAALLGRNVSNLPYGLDVWVESLGKVLNIEWTAEGLTDFVCFHRGDWEERLLSLSKLRVAKQHPVAGFGFSRPLFIDFASGKILSGEKPEAN